MEKNPLQQNLERLMKEKGFNMKSLSLAASLNETAIRDILKGRVASPTYKTLQRIAAVLNCTVEEIVGESKLPKKPTHSTKTSNIDIKVFAKTLAKVDELISKNNLTLSNEDRAKVYLAWYDLSIINQNNVKAEEAQLATILKFARK